MNECPSIPRAARVARFMFNGEEVERVEHARETPTNDDYLDAYDRLGVNAYYGDGVSHIGSARDASMTIGRMSTGELELEHPLDQVIRDMRRDEELEADAKLNEALRETRLALALALSRRGTDVDDPDANANADPDVDPDYAADAFRALIADEAEFRDRDSRARESHATIAPARYVFIPNKKPQPKPKDKKQWTPALAPRSSNMASPMAAPPTRMMSFA